MLKMGTIQTSSLLSPGTKEVWSYGFFVGALNLTGHYLMKREIIESTTHEIISETIGDRNGINQNAHTNFENLWNLAAETSSPFVRTLIAQIA